MAEQAVKGVLRVVGFAGSLRWGSFNRALLDAARQLAPSRMSISRIEIGDLPFYNADVEAEGDPAAVVEFKAAIRAADGILIATPEYNDGIPDGARTIRSGAPADARGHAPGPLGVARAVCALDRPGAAR